MTVASWLDLVRSGSGNRTVTRSGQHRYARCKGRDCDRLPCVAYKDGYDDGHEDGIDEMRGAVAAAYGQGFAAGQAAASKK